MSIPMIFLPDSLLVIDQLTVTEEGITLVVRCTTANGSCPTCHTSSSRIHSHYQRTLKDLPASGLAVQWKLNVRRFFCDNSSCSHKTFAEAVPQGAARSARKTMRLTELLRQLGFALGGEAGAHIASVLKITCSADTFLRLVRKTPSGESSHPHSSRRG